MSKLKFTMSLVEVLLHITQCSSGFHCFLLELNEPHIPFRHYHVIETADDLLLIIFAGSKRCSWSLPSGAYLQVCLLSSGASADVAKGISTL